MGDAALSLALETLGSLLVDEGKFIFSVKDEVEEVQRELNTMHSFLKDADKRPDRYDSETVRNWVSELKDLAYTAEDVLEKYDIKVTSKRAGKGLRNKVKRYGCILGEFVTVRHIGKEIMAIRSQMSKLTQRLEAIIQAQAASGSTMDQQKWLIRQTYAHQVEPHFVGMEEDIKQLVSLTMNFDDKSYGVISICGMGGLGKTSLARKIYQHEDVKHSFDARAWVCISQQFQLKVVLQQILRQLNPEDKEEIKEMDDRELVVELHQTQIQKKCLVVIDDMWETDHWDLLSAAFPIAEASSKVLLTTRNEKIAAEKYVHKLKFLTEDQGWELLQKVALPQDYVQVAVTEMQELERVGREIIHKCGCLPLAISVMGGVLRDKHSLDEWTKVNDNFDTYVKYGETTEKERRVAQVLDLSYEALPYHLKPCFLYLGCYPEDHEIDAQRLYLELIAEGMVQDVTQGTEETLEEVAERYLSELASRCLVQVKLIEFPSMYRRLGSCHLHDLMRDLCLSKAKEEGFLEVMNFCYPKTYGSSVVKARKLAIHYQGDVGDDFNGLENVANLRSLMLINKLEDSHQVYDVGYNRLVSNLDKFSSLKTLILAHCDLSNGKLPSEIGNKLIHLKYLGIRYCILDELPSSVGNLQRLQTLELKLVEGRTIIPDVIYKMKKLKHLFIKYKKCYEASHLDQRLSLDGLTELETFERFDMLFFHVSDLFKLKSLRRFKAYIYDMFSLSVIAHYLSDFENCLRQSFVSIVGGDFSSDDDYMYLLALLVSPSLVRLKVYNITGCMLHIPEAAQHLLSRNLVSVTLSSCEFESDPMETLEKLPMLKTLYFRTSFEEEIVFHASGFPQLQYLFLEYLFNLTEWVVEKGAAPRLSSLIISNCDNLKMLPDGLRFITTLQYLHISSMPKEFMDRTRIVDDQQGQDYDKVRHVSSIVYGFYHRFDNDSDSDSDSDKF